MCFHCKKFILKAKEAIRTWWCLKDEKPPEEYLELIRQIAKEKTDIRFYRVYNLKYRSQKEHPKKILEQFEKDGNSDRIKIRHIDEAMLEGIIVDDKFAVVSFPCETGKSKINFAIISTEKDFVSRLSHWYDIYIFNQSRIIKNVEELDKIK